MLLCLVAPPCHSIDAWSLFGLGEMRGLNGSDAGAGESLALAVEHHGGVFARDVALDEPLL